MISIIQEVLDVNVATPIIHLIHICATRLLQLSRDHRDTMRTCVALVEENPQFRHVTTTTTTKKKKQTMSVQTALDVLNKYAELPGGEQCEQLDTDCTMDQVKRRSADMMAVLERVTMEIDHDETQRPRPRQNKHKHKHKDERGHSCSTKSGSDNNQ